ncbi:Threonine--tRNA ligase [bioreactor metagenome]|uniref:Threonine--tRNA ligase n=1 Tax=bioreactor metagenome TaxID=1076179 RepID=A0A645ESH1_9ZZZZ
MGAFPTWVAPVQVKVLSLTDRTAERAKEIEAMLNAMDYRAESDTRNEKVGFKIREAQNERVPYMLVIGDKELESGDVAVRERGKGDIGAMSLDAFIAMLKEKVDTRAL